MSSIAAVNMGCEQNKVLAFCLFKYFPHGGLQRDMLRIALACQSRGYTIDVYTAAWHGSVPPSLRLHTHRPMALTNHAAMSRYHAWLTRQLADNPSACVVGFNKMPDLDVYYAADGCYKARALEERSGLCRRLPRYRQYQAFEEAVFGRESTTHILMLSKIQEALYVQHYGTPENRIHRVPPNVARDRMAGSDAPAIRQAFRQHCGIPASDKLLLQLGSGFHTKGLDRSILAFAHLPEGLRAKTRLYVVGSGQSRAYARLARRLGVADRVVFLGPRDDVPQILVSADLLIHPARYENTGTALLEALASGLPVIASGVCGYAPYVEQAHGGWVVPEPFRQEVFDDIVQSALEHADLDSYGRRGAEFARHSDLYGMVDAAVDIIEAVACGRLT
jgi:UDP-glucose:(heptosyl)LPS alpha-1,3-glucosyltransferase